GGSEPIGVLDDAGNEPYGCAVNPMNGDLAVAGGFPDHGAPANVALYHKGKGAAKVLFDPDFSLFYWCTYDDRGDLFVEGKASGDGAIDELAQGSNQFARLTVDASFNAGGAIVWDGRYLVVADNPASPKKSDPLTLYQFQLSGSRATLVNTIHLRTGKRNVGAFGMQFAID